MTPFFVECLEWEALVVGWLEKRETDAPRRAHRGAQKIVSRCLSPISHGPNARHRNGRARAVHAKFLAEPPFRVFFFNRQREREEEATQQPSPPQEATTTATTSRVASREWKSVSSRGVAFHERDFQVVGELPLFSSPRKSRCLHV